MKFIRNIFDRWHLILILISVLLVSLPLFKSGYFSYHDIQHLARFAELDNSLKNGQFPIRWVENLGFGYGYPLFVFYPPFIYYLSEFFHLFGFSFITAFKMTLFSGFLLSAFFIYLLVRNLLGLKEAVLATVLYLFLPYRAVTIYVRGAMAEFFSFVWLPAVFWGLIKFRQSREKIYLLLSSLFFTLLVLTHNLVALPFCIFLIIFFIFCLLSERFKNLKSIFLFLVLSLGLSAFFWLPALAEKKYTIVDQILTRELASYKIHFVYPEQLWSSIWGFGGSAEGKLDGLSFKIGKIHVILALLSMLLLVFNACKKKKTSPYLYLFSLFLIISVLLVLPISQPFWERARPLWYLQFPWRFLTFIGFFISVLASFFLKMIKNKRIKSYALILITILIVYFNLKLFKPQYFYPDKNDNDFINQSRIVKDVSLSSFEYLPKGVKLKIGEHNTSVPDIDETEIGKKEIGEIKRGLAEFAVKEDKPQKKAVAIDAKTEVLFRFNTFNFHGWQASLDGRQISILDDNKLKLIEVVAPPGKHELEILYKNYLISLANVISLLALAIYLWFVYGELKPKSRVCQKKR